MDKIQVQFQDNSDDPRGVWVGPVRQDDAAATPPRAHCQCRPRGARHHWGKHSYHQENFKTDNTLQAGGVEDVSEDSVCNGDIDTNDSNDFNSNPPMGVELVE